MINEIAELKKVIGQNEKKLIKSEKEKEHAAN